ncbi:hypothetical protein ROHU_002398 [Labeo rohita]|uniref:Uncharacterized protein n=1 Tax=Labeo rohita TaxID=84645 RepID=A0A498NYR8_LABRO|nr:hypothetical protein ROHU_002398 [Labeo rohita]
MYSSRNLATGKRIRVPKLLDKSPPENSTSERKEAKDNAVDDGVKDSVNVRDIKHFDPKNTTDFSSTQTYWILRKGRFATGQILFMKETCEEIEQFLATGKRIRVPKLLDKSPPENSTSERKEAKDNAVDSTEGKR